MVTLLKEIIRKDDGRISTIFFNRPEKRNALNADALFQLGDIVNQIERENKIRVLVLRGAEDKNFSAGVDLSCGKNNFKRMIEGLEYCLNSLINFSQPMISMIYGPAIGAGLDISVISDFRIAANGASFGAPLVKLGRTYYYTAIRRLTRLIGLAGAKEILLTGRLIDARRALEIGLVNQLVHEDDLESAVGFLANELAEDTAPLAVKVTKLTIKKLFEETPLDPSLEDELKRFADEINQSEDAREGINAKIEKRKPVFSGR
ncbi:enoyl-CoA hydratase-related protein [Desulfobacula sp.]|uniref:enoyl-CoA hydratase/isomerase family protein n=1 Tax=Desulfobacula sp. TaxID=2593537 RepID=UPI0026252687|nr:enoyl-CoA hydratase-related protein [Desulfobacula sp.]